MVDNQKPIIIIGVGRSGSTLLHRMLSKHPGLVWLTDLCDRFPEKPELNNLAMRLLDFPVLGSILDQQMSPGENYLFWDSLYKGFRRPFRDLNSDDVTRRVKRDIQQALSLMYTRNRTRLLLKITGWPRIGFFKEIFPDVKIIHLVRDGRAVVNSMVNVDFWRGWEGPSKWRWGELTEKENRIWEQYHRSFLVLAALEWVRLLGAVQSGAKVLADDQFLEVRYEDLCKDPVQTLKGIVDFAELEWGEKFEQRISQFQVEERNYKWQEDLTIDQIESIERVMLDKLRAHGYIEV